MNYLWGTTCGTYRIRGVIRELVSSFVGVRAGQTERAAGGGPIGGFFFSLVRFRLISWGCIKDVILDLVSGKSNFGRKIWALLLGSWGLQYAKSIPLVSCLLHIAQCPEKKKKNLQRIRRRIRGSDFFSILYGLDNSDFELSAKSLPTLKEVYVGLGSSIVCD